MRWQRRSAFLAATDESRAVSHYCFPFNVAFTVEASIPAVLMSVVHSKVVVYVS